MDKAQSELLQDLCGECSGCSTKPRTIDSLCSNPLEKYIYRKALNHRPDRPEVDKELQEILQNFLVGNIRTVSDACMAIEQAGYRKPPKEKLYEQFPIKKKYRIVSPTSELYRSTNKPPLLSRL